MIILTRRLGLRAGHLLLAGGVILSTACGEETVEEAPAEGGVTADLLASVEDVGTGPRVPVALGNREGAQSVDLAELGFNSGEEGAPVRVMEFSDFGCGYCRRFHLESYPTLEEEYMATGKVEWKYVPMILGMFPNAMEAARLIMEAGGKPKPLLESYAEEVGLDVDRYRQCIDEGWRDERIRTGTQLSREVGVRGTPTFFVVGYAPIPGAIPLDLFRQVLDTVYVQATREDGGS